MKRFLAKANLNPAFKLAQPLPLVTGNLRIAIPADGAPELAERTAAGESRGLVAPQLALQTMPPPAGPAFTPRMHPFTSTAYASVLPGSTFRS